MTVRSKLLLSFLTLAVVPASVVGVLSYVNTERLLKISGENKVNSLAALESIAKLKADSIDDFFYGLRGDIKILQDSYAIREFLPVMSAHIAAPADPEYAGPERELDRVLGTWLRERSEIVDIVLIDPEGRIGYVANAEHHAREHGQPLAGLDAAAFEKSKTQVAVSEVFKNEAKGGKPEMIMAAPMRNGDHSLAAVVAIEIDMDPIYRFVQEAGGLGETGETILVKKIDGEALVLNTLRNDRAAILTKRIPFSGASGGAIQKAALGETGSGPFIDYRGRKVLGAWRYVPLMDWGIVVKIDEQEAFREVDESARLTLLIILVVAVFSVAAAWLIAKSISDPIKRLKKVTDDISTGRLDTKMDKLDRRDEVGDLARSFERILVSLKLAMRETAGKEGGAANKDESRRSASK